MQTWHLAPDRHLRLSPDWTDEGVAVAFDCNAGDYWVISPLAFSALELLLGTRRMSTRELAQALQASCEFDDAPPSSEDVERIAIELADLGILTHTEV